MFIWLGEIHIATTGFVMQSKQKLIYLSLLLFIVAAVNLISRKQLSYSYTEILPYNQIYYLNDQLRIIDIEQKEGDSLTIKFKGNGIKQNNHFEIFTDSALVLSERSENLTIRPDPKQNQFFLRINDRPPKYLVNIDYTPLSVYRQAGNSSSVVYEVTSRDILISPASFHKLSDWDVSSFWSEKMKDKSEIDRYLRDSMNVSVSDSAHIKVLKIAGYLLEVTEGRLGIPSDYLSQLSPVQQLEYIRRGHSRLWCGNYVDLFSFFSSRAGVANRIVSCGNNMGNTALGSHSFNEVFLPEWNRWAYVDLTEGNVFVRKGDSFLNALDLYAALKTEDTVNDGITAYRFSNGRLMSMPFKEASKLARYYFHPGNSFQFLYSDYLKKQIPRDVVARVKKFFYLKPYYATFSENIIQGNYQFYLRLATNYLLAMIGILWLFAVVLYIKKPRHANL